MESTVEQRTGRLDDAQLGRLLTDIRSSTEVDTAFGGLLSPRRDSFAITHTRGARTGELRDLAIHSGLGLGGKSITLDHARLRLGGARRTSSGDLRGGLNGQSQSPP